MCAVLLLQPATMLAQVAPQTPPSAPSSAPVVPAPSAPLAEPPSAAPVQPGIGTAPPAGEAIPQAGDAVTPSGVAVPQADSEVGPPRTMGHAALPRDLSPWGMFVNADVVVQSIMIGLVIASLVTWTVWLAKTIELAVAKRRVRRGVRVLQEARSLDEAERRLGPSRDVVARLVRTAGTEAALSPDSSGEVLKERVAWLLHRIEVSAGRRITRGMGMLASIGAIAPFVGLFGTVWGIMNSFIGISNAQTTNLAVVAPGIAEALLATALGLGAAIPAVVIYNMFTRSVGGYRILVADSSALVMRLVSRDSERLPVQLARAAE
jgi:biopolymer transport protein ExbB